MRYTWMLILIGLENLMKKSTQKPRNKLLWSVLFVTIAAATIWAVLSQSKAFSLRSFVSYASGASKPWLAMALLSMLGFIVFEGEALVVICRAFGYPVSHTHAFVYSASDIYVSAITPSASGGQPACAWFMINDGIPGMVTAVALLANLTMYALSILVLGLVTLLIRPGVFLSFSLLSRGLVILGYLVQSVLAAFFVMLLLKGDLLHGICRKALHLLCKIRLLKQEEEKQRGLDRKMEEYAAHARMIKDHKRAMGKAFFFNMLQRASVISVPFFVFLASGGEAARSGDIWAVQCYTVIGSNAVPIPGAMGVSDYMMLDGFSKVVPCQNAVNFELLSRSVSFYVCVALCGLTVLIKYLRQRKQERTS